MSKLLKIMVIIMLLVSIGALVLGVMLFNQREVIKGRTQKLEKGVEEIAERIRHEGLNMTRLMDYTKMDGELRNVINTAEALWVELQDTKQDLENTRIALRETQDRLEETQRNLDAANRRIEQLEADLRERTQQLEESQREVRELTQQNEELDEQLTEEIARARELEDEVRELEGKVAEQQLQIEELEAELYPEDRVIVTPEGLTGEVLFINPEWNFVVLDVGTDNGLSLGTELMVHRGEELVGRVRVSEVKEVNSVAEILVDWEVAPIEEGDNVLF
jgi:peptidoglycan hydrolase CwlO-like protein